MDGPYRWSLPNPEHDLFLPPSDRPLPTCWACGKRFKQRRRSGPKVKLLGTYCENCYDRIIGGSVPHPETDWLHSNKVDPTGMGQAYMDNIHRCLEDIDG